MQIVYLIDFIVFLFSHMRNFKTKYFKVCVEAVLVRDRGAAHSADLGTSSKESY